MHWYNKPLVVAVCLVLVAFVGYIIWAMHDELTFMIWCGLGSQNTFLKKGEQHLFSYVINSWQSKTISVFLHTVRNLHFLSKSSTLISWEICRFFEWKTCENVVGLDILAVDNFDFTRKIVKKKFGWKTRENVGVLSKLNFWTKILTFPIAYKK